MLNCDLLVWCGGAPTIAQIVIATIADTAMH